MNMNPSIFTSLITLGFFLFPLHGNTEKVSVAPDLVHLETQVISTVDEVKDSVVALVMRDENGTTVGSGSGVIVSEKGLIYTAAHVVEGFDQVIAIMSDESEHEVKVLGMNLYKDAAVCRMRDSSQSYPYSPPGNSDDLKVTDWVIAMGHGRGYDKTRTAPVRFGRVRAHNPGRFITTDCPLIGGDSGGPVFNLEGEVVAINSSINGLAEFNVHAGVSGFTDDLQRMRSGDTWGELLPNVLFTPETPFLGVIFPNAAYGRIKNHLLRPFIEDVAKGGPAAKAGIRGGDLIRVIGDEELDTRLDLEIALGRQKPGKEVRVIVQRGEELLETKVVLSKRESAKVLRGQIEAPRLRADDDSVYVRDRDIPLLEQQMADFFRWAEPLEQVKEDTFIQLYSVRDIEEPLLNATIIKDGIAIAPLSAFESLSGNIFAWRPGIDAHPVELIGGYEEHDLAVLKVEGLKAAEDLLSTSKDVKVGEFIGAISKVGSQGGLTKMGVVSVEKRNLTGFLGVNIYTDEKGEGVVVKSADPKKTGFKMGLRRGCLITKVNNASVTNTEELAEAMDELKVGDEITLEFQRKGKIITSTDTLGGKGNAGSGRIDMMDKLGRNRLSKNTDSFQTVIQSDMLVEPEECGAPIFTLEGDFVGIAISDAGRNKTYIVPASSIQEAMQEAPRPVKKTKDVRSGMAKRTPEVRFQSRGGSIFPQGGQEDLMKRHQEMMDRILERRSAPQSNDPSEMMREMQRLQDEMFRDFFGK